jgi:RNA polymerase sigma factor (sigma-70 family)
MRQLKISKQFTNRENKSLDKYLNEISKVPMIDAQEEVQLAQRIREGDQAALEKLVNANLRFVVSVSKQYQNQGLTLGDLINEGNMGLIKAAKRFDETRGFKFISYAVWWIRQSILQALADQSRIVRLPLNKVGSECPYWADGISTLLPSDHIISEYNELKSNSVTEEINTITVQTLIDKYSISNIDILQIDTEGYDKFIFDELWKFGIRPSIIHIEIVYMKMIDVKNITNLLKDNNYIVYIEGDDLTAIK